MSSKRTSRSKKPEGSLKIRDLKKETNGTDDDTGQEEIEINLEESDGEESSASDKPKKRGGDSSLNKVNWSMPEDIRRLIEKITCCSCGKQLNPMNHGAVRRHPWLKVVTCKKCYKFLRSGPFTRDDDGIDEQCRWCGDGGRLYGCDYCHNCFCRSCIKRNMGRSEAAMMENEDDSKWHCYICKPKKIRKLVEDCEKIINYVASEEKKEREREERAKQREKEKSEKLKEKSKKEVNGNAESKEKKDDKDRKEEKSTPKRSLPAPKDKSLLAEKLTEKKAPDTSKLGMNVSQSAPDLIVVEDSPSESDKPLHHRAINYKPDVKTGVQHVQRISNNVTAVTVGPKNDRPVINPLLKNFPPPRQPLTLRPLLAGMLKTPLSSAPYNVDRGLLNLKKMPPLNDIKALKNNVFPYNVEGLVEKMGTATQALSLSLNSIKTDLAIAKLSQSNMYQAKQTGASQLKNGLEIFFNQVRELLNVQLIANYPQLNPPDKSQGDSTPLSSSSLTSTPKGKSEPLVNTRSENLEESIIPIEIEDSSPVKKVAKKEKMETDDVVIMTDSESKDDVVIVTNSESNEIKKLHIKENKVDKEEIVSGETENCEGKNKEEDEAQKSCDAINIDDDDDDENESDKERNSISFDNKSVHNENENTELSRSKSKTYKKEENDENDKSEGSNLTCETDSSQKEKDQSKKLVEEKDNNKNDLKENDVDSKVGDSENTAAQLELLKEVDDEFNGQEEMSMDTTEPRRSSRNKKPETLESKSESDTESPVRRSSRQRQKPEKTDDKEDKTSSEKRKKSTSDDKKSKNSKEDSDDDEIKECVKKEKKTSDKEKKTLNEKEKKTSGEKERKTLSEKEKKSLRKSGGGSKIEYDVKSDDETVEKKVRKKEKESADSRSRSKKKDESTNDETEEEVKDEKSKKVDGKIKARKEAAANKVSDSDETETDVKETKAKKEDIKKKGSKKVDENKVNIDAEDDVPMDESDTTESSDESVQEFGKRKKKRTAVAKEETSRRQTRQKAKKSESNTENSDTDSDFDPELEREIKSLSKNTRLTRKKAKEAQESKTENKNNKEKLKEKEEKRGKKKTKEDDIDDLSSDIEEVSEVEENDSEEDTDNLSASQLKKLKQAGKAVMEDESDDEDRPEGFSDDSSDDPEVSFPKIVSAEKGKKHSVDDSDDSDFISPKKKKKRIKDKLLDAKISDSESDTGKKGRKGKKKGGKKRKQKDSDEFSELSDEEENRKRGSHGKKRRRIRKIASSEEEDEKEPGAEDKIDDDDDGTQGGFLKRKHIRRVIGSKKLTDETKAAQKAEEERRKRIEERQKEYNTYVEVEGGESEEDELPEGTEREVTTPVKTVSIAKILGSPRKIPITTKCVLEMDKEKKKPLIEVDRTLIRKLKPHQVEAVRFMYNCCIESIERLKKEEGAGCILAHCMGLGKTLSVITFIHTMLSNVKLTKMTKCLVVCPLNTCLNWVNEFEIWLQDVDFEIEVYEMSRVKQNFERAQMLKEWHEGGAAVLIMGYDMYRNLVMGSHCKNKKQKKIFYETLANPGPDLVVCDEGHILKNDATSLSKAMSNIVTHRRIVLTGTPLQNNLGEYHCMVSFVKPSLLGTRREFNNRFCNPISNGQCSDSTAFDVKLMKRRAHILHELLAGCVQRKDYSALTKFLPPKFEYVISVRLSPVQMTLYEKYLEVNNMSGDIRSKGSRLFADYQALMRIWTHPWVLKLDEIRQENKRMYDDEDEDSFIDDSDSEMDSFIDDSTTSPSNSSDDGNESAGSNKKKKKKRKTRRNKGSSSSGDESKKENPDEVVKKWTSKRRGNEEGAGSSWMMDTSYNQGPKEVTSEWWAEFVKEEDEFKLELSGKLVLMFEILKMCEDIGDKVLIFSQSLLSLDIIEDFLAKIDEANNPTNETSSANKPSDNTAGKSDNTAGKSDNTAGKSDKEEGEKTEKTEKTQDEKNKERLSQYGKSWSKGLDYFRMDGSTNSQNRKSSQDQFNDPENYRARLFLISTKAGSLGINLVSANRVIIFDASWNPSHDIQSIFRVYRFGQVKPVYVYRFLAQGTMEEKIYERQVTKQSLSQRVVDEHQIERHFTSSDLQELYTFQPDRLDNSENADKPLPILPKDHMLAELMTNNKEWIVKYHEHDSLLENVVEQELTEDEKKAAWEDYENEKKGINSAMGGMQMNPAMLATQHMNMQNLLMQGQANLGQAAVLQIVQDLKARFPNLPPEVFQQRVQAVLRQVLTQQIMQQSEMQRRQIEHQRMNELNRLNQIKQEIQRQQAMVNNQQRAYSMSGLQPGMSSTGLQSLMTQGLRPQTLSQLPVRPSMNFNNDQQKK